MVSVVSPIILHKFDRKTIGNYLPNIHRAPHLLQITIQMGTLSIPIKSLRQKHNSKLSEM